MNIAKGIARGIATLLLPVACMQLCTTPTSDVNMLQSYIGLYRYIAFGGRIAAKRLVHFAETREPSLQKWSITVLSVPHTYIHIYILMCVYTTMYIYILYHDILCNKCSYETSHPKLTV